MQVCRNEIFRNDGSMRCGSEHPGRPEGEDPRARAAVPQSILLRAGEVIGQAATIVGSMGIASTLVEKLRLRKSRQRSATIGNGTPETAV